MNCERGTLKMKQGYVLSIIFIMIHSLGISQQLYNDVGHIPQDCQQDWKNAGLYKKVYAYQSFNVTEESGANWNVKVKAAVDKARAVAAGGISIVYFPPGNYTFTNQYINPFQLAYPDSNIIFQGAGSDQTILSFYSYLCDDNWNAFEMLGVEEGFKNLDQNISKGSTTLHGDLSGVNAGDWIHFTEYNYDYHPGEDIEVARVGQISKLLNINGSTGTLKDKATKNYSTSNSLRVRKIMPIRNIGIENLKIVRYPCGEATQNGFNFYFRYGVNCWVKGVESDHTARHHLEADYSSHIEITGCYLHHAPSYGGGGHGYGLVLYASTTNSLVENNIFSHLRHAMVSSAGANCNVWTYNYSREQVCEGFPPTFRDLDLHAKYPYANLFEQNWVVTIEADDHFGNNGPYNAFVRNYCFDDENNEWGYINLLNAPNSSVLGCEVRGQTGGVGGGGNTTFAIEKYGKFSDGSIPIEDYDLMPWKNHYQVYENVAYRMGSYLLDLSYYYPTIPQFVEDAGLSFPSLGPNWYWYSQNIPARLRYSENLKTYNPYPTALTSGILTFDQVWSDTYTLTGNVYVPSGITLTIAANAIVNLNGYYLKLTGGTIARESSATFNPDLRLMNGATLKGQYPSSLSAFNDAGSSDELALYTNESWNTDLTVPVNVKVLSGKTLSIPAGRTISFNSNRRLEVYGHLDVDGTSGSRVIFKATTGSGANLWQGVWFYGANNGNLDYLTVRNANYGFRLNANSFVTSEYAQFETNGIGIYANSAGAALYHDEFSGNSTAGISAYSTPFSLGFSTVTNTGADGIQTQSASPDIFQTVITGNGVGVRASGGTIDMGTTCGYPDGGYNSIYGNAGSELWVGPSTMLWALSDWWGQPSIPWGDIDAQGVVNAWCPLSSPPPARLAELPNVLSRTAGAQAAEVAELSDGADPEEMVLAAMGMRKAGRFGECEVLLRQTILDHPDTESAVAALWELAKTYGIAPVKKMEEQLEGDFDDFLLRLSQMHAPGQKDARVPVYRIVLRLLPGAYMRSNQYDRAIELCNRICAESPNSLYEEESLYDLFTIYFDLLHDGKSAQEAYARLASKYPESPFLVHARITLGLDESLPIPIAAPKIESESGGASIGENFPNPFNPETSIAYALPQASQVRIEIYNLLGQKVITLANQQMAAGNHTFRWNGRNDLDEKVAAGLYLCRIQIGELVKTQRMTLLP